MKDESRSVISLDYFIVSGLIENFVSYNMVQREL